MIPFVFFGSCVGSVLTAALLHWMYQRAFAKWEKKALAEIARLRLTDAEREAIGILCEAVEEYSVDDRKAGGCFADEDMAAVKTARGLLERQSYSKNTENRGDSNTIGAPMSDNDKRLKALEELVKLDEELGLMRSHWPENVEIDGLKLECTCGACPEQYDVFDGKRQVGYLRLRHGHFRADCPDAGGETVYESEPQGDGVFVDEERTQELTNAVKAIRKWMAEHDSSK